MSITFFDITNTLGHNSSNPMTLLAALSKSPGKSFLTGYDKLVNAAIQLDLAELKVYLFLAGCRSYEQFLHNGTITLPFELCPFSMRTIELNSLLTLKQQTVFFKYEEEKE